MKVLKLEDAPRHFGNVAVRVSSLIEWSQRTQVVIPPTEPAIFAFPAVHLDSLIEAIRRGLDAGDPDHLVRAAQRMLEAGAPCDPQPSALIRVDRNSVVARSFLRSSIEGFFVQLLQAALATSEFKQLDSDSGVSLALQRGPGTTEAGEADRQSVLRILREQGFDPAALPAFPKGMSNPAKAQAREAAHLAGMNAEAFERAWKQLRERREIS